VDVTWINFYSQKRVKKDRVTITTASIHGNTRPVLYLAGVEPKPKPLLLQETPAPEDIAPRQEQKNADDSPVLQGVNMRGENGQIVPIIAGPALKHVLLLF
jgi:hypothetical protein